MPVEIGEMNSRIEVRSSSVGQQAPRVAGSGTRKAAEFKKQVNEAVEQQLRSMLRELD